jgi:hypothetical protein
MRGADRFDKAAKVWPALIEFACEKSRNGGRRGWQMRKRRAPALAKGFESYKVFVTSLVLAAARLLLIRRKFFLDRLAKMVEHHSFELVLKGFLLGLAFSGRLLAFCGRLFQGPLFRFALLNVTIKGGEIEDFRKYPMVFGHINL